MALAEEKMPGLGLKAKVGKQELIIWEKVNGKKLRMTPLPNCRTLLSATERSCVAEAGLSAFILPAIAGGPNTPGNVAGSSPPGTAGSRRLPELTTADPCKRAEQSPAGQKLGVERITGNKSMQAHTTLFPSTLLDTTSMSLHVPPG